MKKAKEIIVTESGVYEKIESNGRLVIPHSKKNKVENENETTVDELGRIQLSQKIRRRMGIVNNDKLVIYASGKNIILKRLNVKKSRTREMKMIIDNKYEVILQVNNLDLDFNSNHKITTVDEIGRVLIWSEIREKAGITKKDKLKICIKDEMIILIKEDYNYYNKKRNSNYNRRRYYK